MLAVVYTPTESAMASDAVPCGAAMGRSQYIHSGQANVDDRDKTVPDRNKQRRQASKCRVHTTSIETSMMRSSGDRGWDVLLSSGASGASHLGPATLGAAAVGGSHVTG